MWYSDSASASPARRLFSTMKEDREIHWVSHLPHIRERGCVKYTFKVVVDCVLVRLKRYATHEDFHILQTSDEEVHQMMENRGYSPQLAHIT